MEPGTKAEYQTEVNDNLKPQVTSESETEVKAVTKIESQADIKAEVKADFKTEVRAEDIAMSDADEVIEDPRTWHVEDGEIISFSMRPASSPVTGDDAKCDQVRSLSRS
ncbi:hypothetical protein BAUCODRAFT_144567 [Baudoinia panamericana UAMH 10762]|uniref:Uncharacterized protein n=1 Tax=Baudoinia panamericana (strain UAMH 10762) TaxID=717646 RepID=M2NNB3_BAUPA|nr:uncharacterized protein BAUCODRAFT_144567 [Baudoinia panamericana UAMH 10762]EMD00985.1 hypothetical protein BAUCODRAFT_144567 [Baudoinia panamericana UAMH 10762]